MSNYSVAIFHKLMIDFPYKNTLTRRLLMSFLDDLFTGSCGSADSITRELNPEYQTYSENLKNDLEFASIVGKVSAVTLLLFSAKSIICWGATGFIFGTTLLYVGYNLLKISRNVEKLGSEKKIGRFILEMNKDKTKFIANKWIRENLSKKTFLFNWVFDQIEVVENTYSSKEK